MEGNIERDCSALGGLFQQIITDMKNGTPLWEDLVTKATKLHTCLRVAIQAISAYLDAFQKIADAATNARGATKEIGTALTRICLRHKAVEARMKTFTSAIMDCLVVPLQEKLEDWKKAVVNLDKEHAKDYKRARAELKKRSTDTLRLQKKAARKSVTGSLKSNPTPDLQRRVECSLQDVTERRQLLEETEKRAVRAALVEERSRFCLFVGFLKPVVDEEVAMLSELTHLQDAVEALEKHTTDPYSVPPASEQVIIDTRGQNHNPDGTWTFRHTPPSSPSSLGSRKSSMCSISSLNSSSSGSSKSHRSLSQHPVGRLLPGRLPSVSSRDSGFTSQDTLYPRSSQVSNISECSEHTVNSALPNSTATWPNLQETMQFERAASAIVNDRPHTISSAYEKGHQRPGLTVYTFQAPEQSHSQPASPTSGQTLQSNTTTSRSTTQINSKQQPIYARPPLPTRCSSLERPNVPAKSIAQGVRVLPPTGLLEHKLFAKPSSLPAHITKDVPQPTYVNMHDLANLAANKAQELLPPPPPEFSTSSTMNSTTTIAVENSKTSTPAGAAVPATQEGEKDGSTSESSLESSSGYGSQTTFPVDDNGVSGEALYSSSTIRNTLLRRGSIQGIRPPPPVRRTSSISSTTRLSPVGSLENLPPPPAFLLEGSAAGSPPAVTNASTPSRPGINVAETVKALTELKHTPASPGATRRNSQIQQQQQQPQSPVVANQPIPAQNVPQFSSFQPQQPIKVHHNSIYAQPNQVIRINPNSSPNAIRRITSTRSQSADRQPVVSGVGSSFIAALSAKLAPSLSPRNSRRHSEDQIQFPNTNISTTHHLKSSVGATQGFLDTLNAKLAQNHGLTQQKAFKIRQLINSRAQPDPTVCHESLMDQIKRGATLRKAARVNDRSAPKIR
ncbi:mucin-3A isoform X2 [Chrysoperla carnea]|uniref:mucin-3A isoform X2 n=1 Tax=Chrysoperla carnea TaxID=189513 RepID=UPI001D093523|nr:mucin-3A isoform X2 [Chrysoperla carnea]